MMRAIAFAIGAGAIGVGAVVAGCHGKSEVTNDRIAPSASISPSTKAWTGPRPKWTNGPSEAYRCTRSIPEPKIAGEPLQATFLQDEHLDFTLHAEPTDGSTVRYAASDLPAGATLDAETGRFAWAMKAKANDRTTITFVATTTNDGRTEWPFTIVAADDDRDLGWRLGAGVAKSDCEEQKRHANDAWTIRDLDGDGHVDALLSLGGLHHVAEVRWFRDGRWIAGFTREDVDVEAKTATDGAIVLVMKGGCCGHVDMQFARFDPSLDDFGEVGACTVMEGGPDACRVELAVDAKDNVAGCDQVCEKTGRTRLRWKGRTLDLVH
jgi:hypothetical protein